MDICSEIEWYKLAHLATPGLRTILDIGSNKGYLAALFMSLWGGGGYDVSPLSTFDYYEEKETWKKYGGKNPAGFCRDGLNEGYPLYCNDNHRKSNGHCTEKNAGINIRSFDGSSALKEAVSEMILHTGNEEIRKGELWKYYHYPVSDVTGNAKFTKQTPNKNARYKIGFEGGKLNPNEAEIDSEDVTMITVDSFLGAEAKEKGYKYPSFVSDDSGASSGAGARTNTNVRGWSNGKNDHRYHIDIIKIDTEGNDNKVIKGARLAIENTVSLLAFEASKGVSLTEDMIDEFDKKHGYSCYSTSRAGLFKWNGGCMPVKFMGTHRNKEKGNIFCVNRKRAPMLGLLFDALSFPVMLQQVHRDSTSHHEQDFDIETLDIEELQRSYVLFKPYCNPFPSCMLSDSSPKAEAKALP
jgi:hypothetical protein